MRGRWTRDFARSVLRSQGMRRSREAGETDEVLRCDGPLAAPNTRQAGKHPASDVTM
jgi:hypothetical protein